MPISGRKNLFDIRMEFKIDELLPVFGRENGYLCRWKINGMTSKVQFWKEANSRMWSYLERGGEIYSNLNKMDEIYSDIDALEESFWKDYMNETDYMDEELEYELNEALLDASALISTVKSKYYGYRVILRYAKEHPEEEDECRDFYFPDGDYIV